MTPPVIRVERVAGGDRSLPLPTYATAGAAGADIRADLRQAGGEALRLAPGMRARVPTGLMFEIPEGWEVQVRPRSGLALRHGVTVVNAPGTIDADYRGEIGIALINLGSEMFEIHHGDRIAQLVVAPVATAAFQLLGRPGGEEDGAPGGDTDAGSARGASLAPTPRGAGGFGHTGRR